VVDDFWVEIEQSYMKHVEIDGLLLNVFLKAINVCIW